MNSDIAAGMNAIQELGIIHRDLKSPNVLLDQIPRPNGQYILQGLFFFFFFFLSFSFLFHFSPFFII